MVRILREATARPEIFLTIWSQTGQQMSFLRLQFTATEHCLVIPAALLEASLLRTTLEFLGRRTGADKMMAQLWQQGKTLEVVRREPYSTKAAKILPLHVLGEKS